MKKIYMILAALTLLSMSLNAQRLPAHEQFASKFTPTGKATLMDHNNSRFRMPSLNSGEYLFGAYTTDDFDATGVGMAGYYNQAQWVLSTIMIDLDEYQEHLGDTIIGFRFALAGSSKVNVQDFGLYPASAEWFAGDQFQIWNLGQMIAGNTSSTSSTETITTTVYNDITITIPNYYIDFNSIQVKSNGNTVTGGSWTYASNGTSLPSGWGGTASLTAENDGCCTQNGGGTIIIPHTIIDGKENVTVEIAARKYSSSSQNTYITIAGATPTSNTYTTTSYATMSWSITGTIGTTTITTTTNTVDIGRGTVQDEELPAYGFWHDMGYKNQMIYRAEQLAMASGAQITSVTFYPEEGIGIPFSGSTVTFSLANTTTDNFGTGTTGNMITSGFTTVATIVPVEDDNATAWTINFDTPFTYTGGNLVLQVNSPGNGNFGHCYFYGDNQSANVSIKVSGASAQNATSGPTSKFLPKTSFTFTGDVNTPTYLSLQGGEWHDFYLDEPVEFVFPGDSIVSFFMGYTFYQQYDTNFKPIAVNSNSTGHTHYDYMYARTSSSGTYTRSWWSDGASGSANSDRPGDMAVQLIFKPAKQKTPQPTITYTYDNGYYYITATATDPTATVVLNVGGQRATGTGSVTIPVGRIYGQDQTVTATATAQEADKLVSDPTTETITILASLLEPTPTPTITSQVLDVTVQVTGSGQGVVHMYVDGQEVTYPDYYLERTDQQYTVTVTITAQIDDDEHSMSTYTTTVVVPPLDDLDLSGWTRLPGTYANNKVISWDNHLMFVDRFTASTAHNDQPTQYKYVMTEDDIKLIGSPRTTNDHTITVQTTKSKVNGYYTEADVLADRDRQHVDTCLMNADVEMTVEKKSSIYYYTLDRSRDSRLGTNFLELSELQFDGARYVEHDNYFTWQETFDFEGQSTSRTINRFDTINTVLPSNAPQGRDGKHYGKYHDNYMAYVPIVWTWGNEETNMRAFWNRDSLHNSYGSPIWRTGVGKVELIGQPQLERQVGKNGSTNWKEINGQDTISCSLYMIKSLAVDGFLPDTSVSNIKYEPYMFRVWVMSPSGKLRKFKRVAGNGTTTGDHYEGDGTIAANQPYWLWDEAIADSTDYITFPNDFKTSFTFTKQEDWEQNPAHPNDPNDSIWVLPENVNMIFAAPDNITANDIKVLVRFYYRSTGKGLYQKENSGPNANMLMAYRDSGKGYYGVELPGGGDPDPEIPTYIKNVYDFTQGHGEIVKVTYVNMQGMQSDKPFSGINIVITRYSDGSTSTMKVVR